MIPMLIHQAVVDRLSLAREEDLMPEITELLMKKSAKINQKGGKCKTVLQAACANRDINMKLLQLLLNHRW